MRDLTRSKQLYEKALRLIPWGTQTHSKKPHPDLEGYGPYFIERGKGCRIWDVDGNEYIDFRGAFGPIVLGYADDEVNAAVKKQIDSGTLYDMAHPLEIELAELLNRHVPCAERVRFLKTGADANSAAVRIARAVTEREKVISIGYHGWLDSVNGHRPNLGGVPAAARELIIGLSPNDLDGLKEAIAKHGRDAAVLITDLACHRDLEIEYLQAVRELTSENGIVLCYDEIVTGFRYALGGAQEYYGVTPDLACFAKAMANGYSISALCGKAELMDKGFERTTISGTYYGATTDLAASIATIKKLERERVSETLWERGEELKAFINGIARRSGSDIRACGPACIFNLASERGEVIRFWQKLLENGLFPGANYWFMQHSHTEEVLHEVFEIIDESFLSLERER